MSSTKGETSSIFFLKNTPVDLDYHTFCTYIFGGDCNIDPKGFELTINTLEFANGIFMLFA